MRLLACLLLVGTLSAQITADQLLRAQQDPETWLHYGRDYAAWRYSELDEINTGNIRKLAPQWIHQTGVPGKNESTPLVFGGLMYVTGPGNHAWALDLLTGRRVWHYAKSYPKEVQGCCGPVNRGFAVLGDRLFKVNFEGTLVALDAKTGKTEWETEVADWRKGFSLTVAPIVVKDKVLVGISGAEFGVRGYIDAYEAATGKRAWRFYTVPAPGEPGSETWGGDSWIRGGGSAWVTGSYDPELNLVYWGTGNPAPDMNGDVRPGDNLYTCAVVALDADTGKLRWHYQFTPHDVHDWDATEDLPLVDLNIGGRTVKTVIQANRNGFYYVLDRTNGKLLATRKYTEISWAKEIGPDGRPVLVPGQDPTEEGNKACPGLGGGHNWQATAYSPRTGLYYFGSTDGCHIYYKTDHDYVEGQWYQLSTVEPVPGDGAKGSVIAVDAATGETRWRYEMERAPSGGTLATAGGLVFTGDHQGYLMAFDAATGKLLWRFQTGGQIGSAPITYRFRGRQVLAVTAGNSILTFALPAD